MADQRWQANVHRIFVDCLDEGQARILCFNLGIDYDSLCRDPKTGKPQARPKSETLEALIEFCQRHRIVSQFLRALRSQCRDVAQKLPDIPVADSEKRAKIEFHVKADIISFGNQQRAELVQTVAELFDIEQDDIHVLTEETNGAEVHLLLGMPEKDADRLARPVETDSRFDTLHKDYHVRLIQLQEGKLGRWEKLSLWQSHRVHGGLRLLLYLCGFLVLLLLSEELVLLVFPEAQPPRSELLTFLGALPGLAAWVALLVILGKFMQTLFTFDDSRQAFDYFFLCVFGPLFFRYPFVFIQEGQVTDKSKAMPQGDPDGPGGPCLLIVFNDSAVVTERAGRRIAVAGPQVYTAGRFEKIYQTLDLRPQSRSATATCITRDGIPIKAQIGATYRIRWKGEPSAKFPYPADPDALLLAAAGQAVYDFGEGKEVRSWTDRVGANIDVELRNIIARYRLDELLESRDPGLKPRLDLIRNFTEALRKMAANYGAEIIEMHLDTFEFDPELQWIKQQWMDTWRVPWEGQVQVRTAQAEASAIRMKEMAQAYAQLELISAVTREFKATDDESISIDLIILRFVDVISRMAANPDAVIFLPHEALQTLEGVKRMLQDTKKESISSLESPDAIGPGETDRKSLEATTDY